ncbi:ATP-binding protein [Caproicibacter sp.]|uniref:HAMP domain-containing sensor histidine kinase n=1 Tax=Caproicibacter sp. TaxID=2814884 RepID=UPI0039891921
MKKRLIAINAVIVIIGFTVAFTIAGMKIQAQYRMEFTNRLDTALAILQTRKEDILQNPKTVAENVGKELSQSGQQIRISIIDPSGKVVGDSAKEEIDQNHLTRPEIQAALHSGRGYDTRMSASVQQRYYYEAIYLPGNFYLRAALPTAELDAALKRLWMTALLSMLLGIAVVCALTGYLVYRVTEPLQKLSAAAKQISGGDYSCRVEGSFRDEVGELALSFNRMAESTENAVAQLKSQQKQLEGVLQGMNDGVIAASKDGMILFMNQSAGRLLKNPSISAGRKLEGSLLINRIAERMKAALQGDSFDKQNIETEDGKQYAVYTAVIPGQRDAAALAVITDETRIRKLERLRSEFVANVTHELKTPLTSIRGSIELLKSTNRDEKTRLYFYDVLDIEAERLQHLIDDMLVLSQIENAKEDPSARPCVVADAVENCISRLRPVAEKSGISVQMQVDPSLIVSCSPTRLEQLIGNLIENAIKYNRPDGRVDIIGVRQRKTAVIRVKDTGIGIAPEHFGRLFERFYRVDASRSREIGGTGLGLSIVKHLAVLYGGEVGVESQAGKGSIFTVRLPLAQDGSEKGALQPIGD